MLALLAHSHMQQHNKCECVKATRVQVAAVASAAHVVGTTFDSTKNRPVAGKWSNAPMSFSVDKGGGV